MQEQRLTRRLTKYWELVRKQADFPENIKFNAAAIEDVWPYCFRVGVNNRGKKPVFQYEYMGEPIAEIYGKDLTGLVVDQSTKQFPGKVLHYKFSEIITGKKPLSDDGHFINDHGNLIKYRACILPLGTAEKGVTHIIVGLSCRKF